ncbi:MAG: hypothetical protein XD78_1867 [Desulfotomaculum sp. 46_296]|nr:MAG: hypothetical protein XD78_1867 [Desulfotomaculum sp. 46_296]HAU31988.1 hypothetical protein [Desulfotomaculum sp.]
MANKTRGRFLVILLAAVFCFVIASPALSGQGDGSGGGQSNPLILVSSNPTDGQKDVELPVLINLSFSKNVINMTVSDNNRKCFSLYSADGVLVPVEVIMADDQIEPEKKRDIAVKPLQDLKPGTSYTLKVSQELRSKSGVCLENPVSINFVTIGKPSEEKSDESAAGTTQSETGSSTDADKTDAVAGSTTTDQNETDSASNANTVQEENDTVSSGQALEPASENIDKSSAENSDNGSSSQAVDENRSSSKANEKSGIFHTYIPYAVCLVVICVIAYAFARRFKR